jgi:tRNA(Ile2)-agmatinylcytidine synthase
VKDESREVDCAAYEPTGNLRKIAKELKVGDEVQVFGATHKATDIKPLTINLEKIGISKLTQIIRLENPVCPNCGKRLKSMGKTQGFRCEKCKEKFSNLKKKGTTTPRSIKLGLYVTSPRSQRHLTKPIRRYGQEKKNFTTRLIDNWNYVCPN